MIVVATIKQKFELGEICMMPTAKSILDETSVAEAIVKHSQGIWGDLDFQCKEANEVALEYGERLFSLYRDVNGVIFWIITEHDRSVTTILLPEDY